jgi:TatD DNase family protein
MPLIDSHAHIYLDQFSNDLEDVLRNAEEVGVTQIVMPNIDMETVEDMLEVAHNAPKMCYPTIGLHPCSVKKHFEKELYKVEDWLTKVQFMAIGEMGTDLYWDKSFWAEQQEAFRIQIELAKKHNLPFIIHCRDSIDETIELIEGLNSDELKGVFHCFTGNIEQATRITDMGFKLGIGGVATFKNGGLGPVIEALALDHILLETDSPYLAPVPYRGKRNEPAYTKLVAEKIAEVKHIGFDKVAAKTTENSKALFNLA